MTSVIYICPRGDTKSHVPGECPRHRVELEKKCPHCGHPVEECICN